MPAKDIGARETTATVRVRADGEVDEESLAYFREKVAATLDRPGLPLADRLHARLRSATERVAHRGDTTRRTAAPPRGVAARRSRRRRTPAPAPALPRP
ncbi:hypothetical protein [Streptomyces sp. NBC_01216]|uniref:hypothetical protein n=1 Tax=unclassified Streptomyces TaxID=2593676 RepID=UPI002E13A525|nr:hypothetical protein OG393_02755 [Streptomyces sp. NBC_01216]